MKVLEDVERRLLRVAERLESGEWRQEVKELVG